MPKPKLNPNIKSIDDLLRITEEAPAAAPIRNDESYITQISPMLIKPFTDHPFHLYEGERLDDLVASIRENGILTPVIVRSIESDPNGYSYEMLAGHNRMRAAQIIGLETIPCIKKENLSDEEALMYVVETNVLQRSFTDMLPSEKATVLSMRYSKMFSQGKRNDIIEELKKLEDPLYHKENQTSSLIGTGYRSDVKLADEYGLAKNTVARLLRVDKLITSLKHRVDTDEIGLYAAVDISYLTESEQQLIEDVLSANEYKVDMKKAELLRSYTGKLTSELTDEILSGKRFKKPKSDKPQPFKLKPKIYEKYFTHETKAAEMERIIDEALAMYFKTTEVSSSD